MSDLNDALLALQTKVAEHLAADAYFAGVEILTEKKGDIRQGIKTALNRLGLGLAVITPGVTIKKRLGRRLVFSVTIVIEVAEIVLTNQSASGTKKPALAAATAAMLALDSKPNGRDDRLVDTATGTFYLDDAMPLRLIPDKAALVYHVLATTDIILTVS